MSGELDAFEALAGCIEAVVFVTDLSMRMLYASAELEKRTGFTAADFQFPQADNPFIHREDAERVGSALAAFVASSDTVLPPLDNRFLDRWGRTHRVRSTVSKIVYRGTTSLLFVCHILDSPEAISADVESANDAIVRLDNAGRILFANRRTRELLGYSAVELGRLRLDDLVAVRDRATLTDNITRAIGSQYPVKFSLAITAKHGRTITVQAVVTSLGSAGFRGELLAALRPVQGPGPSDSP
jgi:PAS domain S-box-containing protein